MNVPDVRQERDRHQVCELYTYIYIHIYIPHHPQVNMYIFTIVRTRTCYYTTIACGKVILKKSKRMRKEKTDRDPDLEVSGHDHR
jgi:hypothetical protein